MAKHYVKIDESNRVIKGFSDEFEQPVVGDICINEDGGRHFELNGIVNAPLFDDDNISLYGFDGEKVIERTSSEIAEDKANIQTAKTLEDRLAVVEALVSGTPSYGELLEAVNILLEA